MSDKALSVMEMPKNCDQCKIRAINLAWCNIARKSTSHYPSGKPMDERIRPDWCPLKPMPEKKECDLLSVGSKIRIWREGWNACIDRVLEEKHGETDTNED